MIKRILIVIATIFAQFASAAKGPVLTLENIPFTYEGLAEFGLESHKITRWPDGPIKVYDETGFLFWDRLFAEYNPYLHKSRLQLTSNKEDAQIVVIFGAAAKVEPDSCAITEDKANTHGELTSAKITIDESQCSKTTNSRFIIYAHEMGHALGMLKHAPEGVDDVMSAGVYTSATQYPASLLKTYLKAIYGLPPGIQPPFGRLSTITKSMIDLPTTQDTEIASNEIGKPTNTNVVKYEEKRSQEKKVVPERKAPEKPTVTVIAIGDEISKLKKATKSEVDAYRIIAPERDPVGMKAVKIEKKNGTQYRFISPSMQPTTIAAVKNNPIDLNNSRAQNNNKSDTKPLRMVTDSNGGFIFTNE